MISKSYLPRLQQALKNLAAGPDDQSSYLQSLGVAPGADELALELDDLTPQVEEAVRYGVISPTAAIRIKEVEVELESMSQDEHLWTVDALKDSSKWDKVRTLAMNALAAL